jgi:hypothetical protein
MVLVANYLSKKDIMKIVVFKAVGTARQSFVIQVTDEQNVIHTEIAHGVKKRDEVIWRLAEVYEIDDIQMKEHEKPQDFKFSEIPNIPVLDSQEAEEFFEANQTLVYTRILEAVEEAMIAKKNIIRLFELDGTGEYLTSKKIDWKEGLYKCIDHFTQLEDYEKCIIANKLISKL